jgi:hypothetical protein
MFDIQVDRATLALFVSALALFYTIYKSTEERRRWQSTNLPRFLVRPQLMFWREVTLDQFRTIEWGYADYFATPFTAEDGAVMDVNKLQVPCAIVAYDGEGGVLEAPPALTSSEMTAEIVRRGLHPDDYRLMKWHRIVLSATNIGLTAASNVRTASKLSLASGLVVHSPTSTAMTLEPHEIAWSHLDWYTDLEEPFSPEVIVEGEVEFSVSKATGRRLPFRFTYDRNVAAFRRT